MCYAVAAGAMNVIAPDRAVLKLAFGNCKIQRGGVA
jgi:hypothetical protein